jgi:hypothetical protein
LVTWPTSTVAMLRSLADPGERSSDRAHLRHAARAALDLRAGHGLHAVEHQQVGLHRVEMASTEPRSVSAASHSIGESAPVRPARSAPARPTPRRSRRAPATRCRPSSRRGEGPGSTCRPPAPPPAGSPRPGPGRPRARGRARRCRGVATAPPRPPPGRSGARGRSPRRRRRPRGVAPTSAMDPHAWHSGHCPTHFATVQPALAAAVGGRSARFCLAMHRTLAAAADVSGSGAARLGTAAQDQRPRTSA